jgi:hypothetical protein
MNPNAIAFARMLKMSQFQESSLRENELTNGFIYANYNSLKYETQRADNQDLNMTNSLQFNQSLLNDNIHKLKTVKNDLFSDNIPIGVVSHVYKTKKHQNGSVICPKNTHLTGNWHCKPCGKFFDQNATYVSHCKCHEQCKHKGCDFMGTRKVLENHFNSFHGQYSGTGYKTIDIEGQKFKVLLGTVPEEVCQWRENRKRKFPSVNNIAVKQKEASLFVEGGGILDGQKPVKNTHKFRNESPCIQTNNSLYKRLLNDEIMVEEIFVLQCIHFLVQRNYLK